MERHVAIKKISKILGKSLGYRVNANAPTREERQAAKAALPAAAQEKQELSERMAARSAMLLSADSEYQALKVAFTAARKHVEKLSGTTHHYKITVGVSTGMFFCIRAEGDSWEEVIEKLTAKKPKASDVTDLVVGRDMPF